MMDADAETDLKSGATSVARNADDCGCTEQSCEYCSNPSGCSNCTDCCCPSSHREWRRSAVRRSLVVQYLNNSWMAVEVAGGLLAGFAALNFALLAFGGDSVIELISGVVVMLHLRNNDTGGWRGELGASRISRYLLLALLPAIGGGAIFSYLAGTRPETSLPGLVVAALAVVIMPFFWFEKRKLGRKTNCVPLRIDAVESATCLSLSVVLLAGLLIQWLMHAYWVMYIALGLMLFFIGREALEGAGSHKSVKLLSG